MANTNNSASKAFTFDRPPTPRGQPRIDKDRPHPLRSDPPCDSTKNFTVDNAAPRRMPANPPSSPAMLSEPNSRSASPRPTHGRPRSPLSPPATPPPTARFVPRKAPFTFSKRLVKSKKLSSAVHGTLTEPVIYQLSDDD